MRWLVCLGLLAVVACAVEARSLAESANTLSAGLSENINIQGAPVATSDGYQLDGGVKVTTAQLVALKSKLNVKGNTLTKPVTGFFRTTLRRCIQAMIKGFSPADMNEMLNAPGAQKTFGAAMAVSYFPVPSIETISPNVCYLAITVKSGTPKYDPAIVSAAGIQATTPGQIEALGALVGYYKQYDASTIHIFNTSSIAKIEIAYKDWPEWIDYRTMKPAPYTARPPNMTLLQMWDLLEGPGGVREILKKDLGLQETHQAFTSLSWFKSFLIYMHYTDGIQVVRTIRQTNPWAANEPQNFAAFQKAYTSLLNARITQRVAADNQVIVVDGYKYMLSAIGYLNKAVWEGWQPERWATRIATEALPRLCKLVTGSSKSCAYRWRPASYGGSPSNLTYNAKVTGNLGRQLYQLQQNPYLIVRSSTSVAQDSVRIHYYHPDPLHLNSKLESRVDPALWKLMKTTNYSANPALLKEHGAKLTQGLIYETLKRHSGKPIGNTIRAENLNENQSALSLLRDILAIHPFYEFNDRIAYFLMAVIELESSGATGSSWSYGNVRAPFISDFALLSSLGQYQTQLTSETDAMNTLRGELFVEWLRGLGSKKPQYFSLPAWGRYVDTALAPLRAGKHIEFNDSDYELIRVRRFGELMERKVGPQWFTYYT